MENLLPVGWVKVQFGELTTLVIGGDWGEDILPSDDFTKVKIIRGAEYRNWDDEKGSSAVERFINKKSLETRQLQLNDLVIEISGGGPKQPVGRIIIIDEDVLSQSDLPFICTNFFRLIRLSTFVNSNYVAYNLKFQYLIGNFDSLQNQTTNLRNLQFKRVENEILIPLTPLHEQTRIAVALDEYIANLRTAETALDEVPPLIRQFRQKVLAMAVSGELTKGWREEVKIKNWELETVTDLLKRKQKILLEKKLKSSLIEIDDFTKSKINEHWIELKLDNIFLKGNIFDGPFGSNLKSIDYRKDGVRVIRLENIGFMEFYEEKETFVSYEKYKSLIKHEVFEGDIIFSSFISEKIRATILPELPIKAIAKSDCFCLRPMEDIINKEFLLFLLSSQQAFDLLTGNIHGSTRPRINTSQLKELVINLPPFAEQTEIVNRIKELFNIANEIETAYDTARAELKVLPQVLLSKAFKGELLAPSVSGMYESAEVLLARIKEAKAALLNEKGKRKKGN